MTLSSLRIEAEQKAAELIASLRDSVVAEISMTGSLSGVAGDSLRKLITNKLENAIPTYVSKFAPEFTSAWNLGLQRAANETLGIGHTPVYSPEKTTSYRDNFEKKLWRIESKLADEIDSILLRASVSSSFSKDSAVTAIGNRKSGPFGDADRQTVGMVSQLLTDIEETAHYDQAHLLLHAAKQSPDLFQKKDQKKLGAGVHQKLVTLMVQVWYHSHGGNPPRANHLAMDGKAVLYGDPFTLIGKDGTVYDPKYPKDPILPPGETINCHCVGVTKVLTVSQEQHDKIVKRLQDSGGYKGSLLNL